MTAAAGDAQGDSPAGEGPFVRELAISNKRGLHARASAKFVQTVEKFEADVWVTRGGVSDGGPSILGLMMHSAAPGTTITDCANTIGITPDELMRSGMKLRLASRMRPRAIVRCGI